MIHASEARSYYQPHLLFTVDDFSLSTGGAISRSIGEPDVFRISAGYLPPGADPAEIRIILDDPSIMEIAIRADFARSLWRKRSDPTRAVPLRDRLVAVKAGLGLSTKELAEVLGCARATVYLWLDPNYQGQVNDEAMERLAALERLTKTWNAFGVGALGARLHGMALEAEAGRSLFALLKEAPIDVARGEIAMRAIAVQCHAQIDASRRVDDIVTRGFGV